MKLIKEGHPNVYRVSCKRCEAIYEIINSEIIHDGSMGSYHSSYYKCPCCGKNNYFDDDYTCEVKFHRNENSIW